LIHFYKRRIFGLYLPTVMAFELDFIHPLQAKL